MLMSNDVSRVTSTTHGLEWISHENKAHRMSPKTKKQKHCDLQYLPSGQFFGFRIKVSFSKFIGLHHVTYIHFLFTGHSIVVIGCIPMHKIPGNLWGVSAKQGPFPSYLWVYRPQYVPICPNGCHKRCSHFGDPCVWQQTSDYNI